MSNLHCEKNQERRLVDWKKVMLGTAGYAVITFPLALDYRNPNQSATETKSFEK